MIEFPEFVITQAPVAVLFAIFATALFVVVLKYIDKTNEKFTTALREQRQEFSKTVELLSDKFGGDIMAKLDEIDDKLPKRKRSL